MFRLIAVSGFALLITTSVHAMTPSPLTAAAAGRHDDASCSRLWSGSDTGQRCLRGTNHHAPNPPSRPQVRAMAGQHLRIV